jgi:sulfur carrier protein ThiS
MTKTNKHGVVMPFIIRPLQLHELMMAEGPTINRMLTELEIECARQAVKNNGKIIHTYADFERSGTIRKAIKPGIRRLGQIGVLRKRSGRPGVGGYERPHHYRLTYLPTWKGRKLIPPTNEWLKTRNPVVVKRPLRHVVVKRPLRGNVSDMSPEVAEVPIKRGFNGSPKTTTI